MSLNRRTFLRSALGVAAGASLSGLAGCATTGVTAMQLPSTAPLPEPFQQPLTIPPIKQPLGRAGGVARYQVVQRKAALEILPGLTTEIWGYDGIFPGPTFSTRCGEQIVVEHRNTLDVPTTVHLHGGHTPPDSDGYPIDLVLPESGGSDRLRAESRDFGGDVSQGRREYTYPLQQRAATLWYHDHRMDFTAPQVWRGLAGMHVVRDDAEDALPLPAGDREVPLILADRSFHADGSLMYPALDPELVAPPGVSGYYMAGVMGDVILVNGTPWPSMEVDAARYRFRILNASNARRYTLTLDPQPPGGPPFVQIGSDGGLLAAPIEHATITVAPGERFDVVVDFSAYPVGTEVTMVNTEGDGPTRKVVRFVVARTAPDDSSIPDRLSELEILRPGPGATLREWRLTRGPMHGGHGWLVNGKPFDPHRMDAAPPLGEVEVWRFYADLHHPVHVHLDPFQVLSRGGREPGPYDAGWKDTVDLSPTEYVDVAVRFSDYTGQYLLHCHNLEHEDMAMMSAFETVAR